MNDFLDRKRHFAQLVYKKNSILILGVLSSIRRDFDIGDDKSGLLQTAFILSYMVFAPLFGYLGDRYNRKFIMSGGVFLWCLTTFIGSYMKVSISLSYQRVQSKSMFKYKNNLVFNLILT